MTVGLHKFCGELMPPSEEMFKHHGLSRPCRSRRWPSRLP